jgi:hypothetical protein
MRGINNRDTGWVVVGQRPHPIQSNLYPSSKRVRIKRVAPCVTGRLCSFGSSEQVVAVLGERWMTR